MGCPPPLLPAELKPPPPPHSRAQPPRAAAWRADNAALFSSRKSLRAHIFVIRAFLLSSFCSCDDTWVSPPGFSRSFLPRRRAAARAGRVLCKPRGSWATAAVPRRGCGVFLVVARLSLSLCVGGETRRVMGRLPHGCCGVVVLCHTLGGPRSLLQLCLVRARMPLRDGESHRGH